MTEQEPKPIHESIVPIIGQTRALMGLTVLADLIKTTKFPKGHDEIAEAWNETIESSGFTTDFGVPESLQKQKVQVQAETRTKSSEQAT